MKTRSGIYKITNMINGKYYIGQACNLRRRKWSHLNALSRQKHCNPYMQNVFNKYGVNSLMFETLLICEKSELTFYEQQLVDSFNPEYNIRKLCVNSPLGVPCSQQRRERISKSNKGKIRSEEIKDKYRGKNNHWYGKRFTEEQQARRTLAVSGERHHFYGKHLSDEHKKKLSLAKQGDRHPNYGKHLSGETKKKISETKKAKILLKLTAQQKVNALYPVLLARKEKE